MVYIIFWTQKLRTEQEPENRFLSFSRPLFLRFELDDVRVSVILTLQTEEGLRGALARAVPTRARSTRRGPSKPI